MFITKKRLSRRTFLRGALGTAVALPMLDAMVPALAAQSETRAPFRFGAIYYPVGIYPDRWHPEAVGRKFEMKPPMSPLGPFRDQMITVSGMEAPYGNSVHLGASSAFLNGVGPVGRNGAAIESAKTVDQYIADKHAGDTPFPSLEIGTESLGTSVGSCDDFACIYFNALSWRDETTPRTVEINPRITFERMFGEAGTPEQRLARLQRKQSMLDSVAGEALKLQQELGPADNRILTEYLENIRQVERQLEQMEKRSETADIEIPASPIGIPESFDEYLTLSYDLMHLAFQGDITRVFTFLSGLEASDRSYAFIGVPEAHHTMSHHGNDPEKLEKYTKIGTYHVMKFSQFLGKLAATPDGDGSLLDHSVLYWGSGMSDGNQHERSNPPAVVVGGANGRMKGGRHIAVENEEPTENLLLGLADLANVESEKIGESTGLLDLS